MKAMIKRAAIYVRVSRAYTEDDERVTIAAQLADCETLCQERGYTIVAQYIDKDKYRVKGALVNPSGARKDRPAYLKMLKAAQVGEFDVIVAWKEDRLYRGMYAALPLSEVLDERRNDLRVELVKESFDRQMLGIKAAIAKLELDNIRDRMIMGRKVRIERGEPAGGPIRYGYYKNENKQIVINESEASVVRKIYDLYNQGENNMEIRRRLNAAGIAPRINKIWSKASISNILTFEGYATGKYTTSLDGEIFVTPCPPIIPLSVWQKAIETREANKKYRGRNVKEDYLCRGMVTCSCGWAWTVRTCRGGRQKGKSGFYGCAKKDHKPEAVQHDCPGTIGAKKLDTFVWEFVVNICQNPEIVQDAIHTKIALLQEKLGDIESEANSLQNQLAQLADEKQWVITTARKGKISEEDKDKQLAAIDLQAMELRKMRDDKLAAILVQQQTERLKDWANQYLTDLANGIYILGVDLAELSPDEFANLYQKLGAHRFEEKYSGDTLAALKWAVLEEKRKTVRMLISRVLVVKDPDGSKRIVPQVAFELPDGFASLVYDHQSLAYVEQARELIGD
jgi:site-specific DNA recombinase